MSGLTWTFKEDVNCKFGYGWEERGKIDWFAHKGNSEEVKEIKEEIHKFKLDKDYSYTASGKVENRIWEEICGEECEKYTIHNEELKKKLWETTKGDEELEEHERKMAKHARIMKEHKKKVREHEKIIKKLNKFGKNPTEYEKICPNCLNKNDYKVQPGDINCQNCSTRLIEKSKFNLSEKEDKWKWREFWVGISAALVLFGLLFGLIKLLRKKK